MDFKLANRIELAAKLLNQGKVIIVPTDTVYGIAAVCDNPEAHKKIYQIKQRSPDLPLIAMIASFEDLGGLVAEIPAEALDMMRRFWPGALTLIFRKKTGLKLNEDHDTIGVRWSDNEILNQLIHECGQPLLVTSANLSGKNAPALASEIDQEILSQVAFMLEADQPSAGLPSTIVDISDTSDIRIIRAGAISKQALFSGKEN